MSNLKPIVVAPTRTWFVAVAQYEDTALSSVSTESADRAMSEVRRLAGGFPHPFAFTWQEWNPE